MIASPDDRRRELAQIHIAKKDLGIDEDTYRLMLRTIARVDSAADLNAEGRRQVIAHLKARGFKPKIPSKPSKFKDSAWDWVNNAAPDQLRRIVAALEYDRRRRAEKAAAP